MAKRPGWTRDASAGEFLKVTGILAAREAALNRAALVLQSEWDDVLGEPGAGRLYEKGFAFITSAGSPRKAIRVKGSSRIPGRTSDHVASKPFQPPAPDRGGRGGLRSGVLIDNRKPDLVRVGFARGELGMIALALNYGVNVGGTRVRRHPATNLKIMPRPHAEKAGAQARPLMTKAVRAVFRSEVNDVPLTGNR